MWHGDCERKWRRWAVQRDAETVSARRWSSSCSISDCNVCGDKTSW